MQVRIHSNTWTSQWIVTSKNPSSQGISFAKYLIFPRSSCRSQKKTLVTPRFESTTFTQILENSFYTGSCIRSELRDASTEQSIVQKSPLAVLDRQLSSVSVLLSELSKVVIFLRGCYQKMLLSLLTLPIVSYPFKRSPGLIQISSCLCSCFLPILEVAIF